MSSPRVHLLLLAAIIDPPFCSDSVTHSPGARDSLFALYSSAVSVCKVCRPPLNGQRDRPARCCFWLSYSPLAAPDDNSLIFLQLTKANLDFYSILTLDS